MDTGVERLDVRLSVTFKAMMVVATVISLGLLPLAFWLIGVPRKFPRALDAEGVTLRNGERHAWRDFTSVRKTSKFAGLLVAWTLFFGKKAVVVAPINLAEGRQVFAFLRRVLGNNVPAA